MSKSAQKQFTSFKRLPELPTASNTPRSKSPRLFTLRESSRSSYHSQIFPNDNEQSENSNKSTNNNNNKFGGDPCLFGRFIRKKYDADIDKEKSISKKCDSLQLYSHNSKSNRETSVSIKPRRNEYSQIDDHDDDEEEEEPIVTNICDTNTDVSNGFNVFRRKRGAPKTNIIDDNEFEDGYNETTEISHDNFTEISLRQRAASSSSSKSVSSTKYSLYSMRDELNLQKLIINTTVSMHCALPQRQSTDISFGETMSTMQEKGEEEIKRYVKDTLKQYETSSGFAFYVDLRNMVSLLTLIAIGTMQFVYYRYYYLCAIFTSLTSIFYILLFIPSINHSLNEECLCSFSLVVIRLFHIISILTIFCGVETCLFHYEKVVQSTQNNGDLNLWFALLWIFIILAIILCYLQNVYIIKYDEFVVIKWKLIYLCKAQYYINDDGSWRADLHPIQGFDAAFTTFLFITTFAAIITAVICIHKMQIIMKRYGL